MGHKKSNSQIRLHYFQPPGASYHCTFTGLKCIQNVFLKIPWMVLRIVVWFGRYKYFVFERDVAGTVPFRSIRHTPVTVTRWISSTLRHRSPWPVTGSKISTLISKHCDKSAKLSSSSQNLYISQQSLVLPQTIVHVQHRCFSHEICLCFHKITKYV